MHFKNFLQLFVLVLILAGVTGCEQFNARKAVNVNDEVVAGHKKLMLSLEAFISALDERNSDDIQNTLQSLKTNAEEGMQTTADQEALKCNTTFLPASEEMFRFYSAAAANEYAVIAAFYGRDSISYIEYDSLQVIIQQVESAQSEIDRAFLDAQQTFAQSCGFKLVRNVE